MPAPVPPGFTRGAILFLGPTQSIAAEAQLLQRFWSEAGGYGSRILLLTCESNDHQLAHYTHQLQTWEVDTISPLVIDQRALAFAKTTQEQIEHATAILFLRQDVRRLARLLGGTPSAQTIRRANARGKTVGALGEANGILCQHMLCRVNTNEFQFYPGLGIVNRLAILPNAQETIDEASRGNLLLQAIAPNPFLVGVSLEADTGLVIYPDTTLEVFGNNQAWLIDGAATFDSDLSQLVGLNALAQQKIELHRLLAGDTFNFDQRTVMPQPSVDAPDPLLPPASKSPF